VITVDYREAPENVFPAARIDVAAVYAALLKQYSSAHRCQRTILGRSFVCKGIALF
jgi:acetyl esterase/lipase